MKAAVQVLTRAASGNSTLEGKVAAELAQCSGCGGLPCRKKFWKGSEPVLDGAVLTMRPCKYTAASLLKKKSAQMYNQARLPARYLNVKFADYAVDADNRSAVEFAKVAGKYTGAYFYGAVGTGKTFLAVLLAKKYLSAGKSVLFVNTPDLLTEFYEVYRGGGKIGEKELLKRLYTTEVLVLDDFGLEKPTQFTGQTCCKIIEARYNGEGLMTLITSNYSLEQMRQRLNNPTDGVRDSPCYNGSRLYDRLIEICKPIHFKGESRRR